ncbi:WD40-repeat-containing domain protein [Lipomyces kononenkoae]|uniref:WD40-repeat-containing domain protein n=1 Tax=Lipomyces kononenkoae TaxID=34357 RepID=A0ACC3T216_LIPKO
MQYQLHNAPLDIISSVRFNPSERYNSFLLASSWDATLSLYDASVENGKLLTRADGVAPLLDCCWHADGRSAFIGGLEGRVRMVDLESGQCDALGDHGEAVKSVLFHKQSGLVVSGSWDRTVQLHDCRSGDRVNISPQPHKVFSMDMTDNLLVVGMAGRAVHIYDIRHMGEPFQRRESSLKYMTRAVKCIPTGEGYASSSIEGRIAVDFFDASHDVQAKKYAFKCHRAAENDVDAVYSVNALAFHPLYGTFVSGGSDSLVCFWDYKARKRLRQYPRYPGPIQALEIDCTGSALAISYGGDVEVGMECDTLKNNGIVIRSLVPGEGKSKV